jgi:hypothetical protein
MIREFTSDQSEKHKARCKAYYQANKEKSLANDKIRYQLNKPQKALYSKSYSQTLSGKYAIYKSAAKTRGIRFDLTIEEFGDLWQQSCEYCGSSIETIGIDRKDSYVGYVLGNIVPCCSICNSMKLDHSFDAFISHIEKIHTHHKLGSR